MFKAMILAAGKGERMRPLTDTCPKPLLRVGGKMLIEYHLEKFAQAGFTHIIINHAYLGNMIETALQDGKHYGIHIQYSPEPLVLETAGGIAHALPLLTDAARKRPFAVTNADIFCNIDFSFLQLILQHMQSHHGRTLAHLILVDNPSHHPEGDFFLNTASGKLTTAAACADCQKLTFSGIGIYHPALFENISPGRAEKLAPLLHQAVRDDKVNGSYYSGLWMDIGTPERLRLLDARLNHSGQHL